MLYIVRVRVRVRARTNFIVKLYEQNLPKESECTVPSFLLFLCELGKGLSETVCLFVCLFIDLFIYSFLGLRHLLSGCCVDSSSSSCSSRYLF